MSRRFAAVLLSCLMLVPGSSADAGPPREGDKPVPQRTDRYGDPLPPGAVARLGTVRFRHGDFGLRTIAFLPAGDVVVCVTEQPGSIHFWETRSGRLVREIPTGLYSVRGAAVSPDGKYVAVGGHLLPIAQGVPLQPRLRVLDAGTGKEVWSAARDPADMGYNYPLAFTPDSKLLISLQGNGVLRIEEATSGVELLREKFPDGEAGHFAVSPDGSKLAVAAGPDTRKLYLWDWPAGTEPRELKLGEFVPSHVCFSPDGKTLAATSQQEVTLCLWDVKSGRLKARLLAPAGATIGYGPAFSPDGKLLATIDYGYRRGHNRDSRVLLWDVAAGKVVRELATPGSTAGLVTFSADGRWLAGGAANTVHVWDLTSNTAVGAADAHQGALDLVVTSSGGLVATASEDHTVRLWDGTTGRQLQKLQHGNGVRGLALSPDGSLVASSSLDDTVGVWEARTGREIYRLAGHGNSGGRRAVGFLPDGKQFLSFGDDYYLRRWDVRTGKVVREDAVRPNGVKVPGEDAEDANMERLLSMAEAVISQDGKRLVLLVAGDFHVFDAATNQELRQFHHEGGSTYHLALSPDGKTLLANSYGKSARIQLPDGRIQIVPAGTHVLSLYDLSTTKLVKRVEAPGRWAGPVAFSADGKLFASAGGVDATTTIRVWDASRVEQVRTVEGFRGQVRCLAFMADGRRLVSGMQDTTALVWDLTGEPAEGR